MSRRARKRDAATRETRPAIDRSHADGSSHLVPAESVGAGGLGTAPALLVFALALAVRAAVAFDLRTEILVVEPQLDAREALEWARRFAGGDWRLPPYPTRGFLHPAFLGLLLAIGNGSRVAVQAVQLSFGAVTAVLLASVAARSWGRAAGVATGVVAAFYAPLAFVDGVFWEEPLLILLLVAGLWLVREEASAGRAALAGLAIGAAACIRPTAWAVLVAWAAVLALRGGPAARRRAAAFLLAAATLSGAGVAAVSSAAGFLLPIRGYGGLNVWMGNDPAGGGVQSARLGGAWDRLEAAPFRAGVEALADYDAWFARAAVERAMRDPAGAARVLASKLGWLLSAEEVRESQSFHYFRSRSRLLAALPGFALLLGLATAGVIATRQSALRDRALVAAVAALAATLLATVVGFRYRLPVAALLLPLAGVGLAETVAAARRNRRRAAGLALVVVAVAAATSLRRHPPSHRFAEELAQAGLSHLRRGDRGAAELAFRGADAADPASALGPDGLGMLLSARGEVAAARARFDEAIRRDPDFQRARVHRAEIALREGQMQVARHHLEASFAVGPRHLPTLQRLLPLVRAAGERERAADLARRIAAVTGGGGP